MSGTTDTTDTTERPRRRSERQPGPPAPPAGEATVNERLRPLRRDDPEDVAAVERLALAAWAPVFRSFKRVLGAEIYARLYPDWRASQKADVERVCTEEKYTVWVAEAEGQVAGYVAYTTDAETKVGEVYMLAVDPGRQRRGLGTRLNALALDRLREAGMELAQVSTGGDPGHEPARRSYEKAGYTAFPTVWYFQLLHPSG
jgi:ribosomal protein S18 acetylase RimI-like enzyme